MRIALKVAYVGAAAVILAALVSAIFPHLFRRDASAPLSPIVSLIIKPKEGKAPLNITADASGSNDPAGDVLTYEWFVDSQRRPEQTSRITLLLTDPGVVELELKVSTRRGTSMTTKRFIRVVA